jgi:hypothetical protein
MKNKRIDPDDTPYIRPIPAEDMPYLLTPSTPNADHNGQHAFDDDDNPFRGHDDVAWHRPSFPDMKYG